MNTDQQLEQRVRETLQAVASQFEPTPPDVARQRSLMSLGGIAAVLAAMTIAAGVLYVRRSTATPESSGAIPTSAMASSPDRTGETVRLIEPNETSGYEIGRVTIGRRDTATYLWVGAFEIGTTGDVVIVDNGGRRDNEGRPFSELDGERREINGREMVIDRTNSETVTAFFEYAHSCIARVEFPREHSIREVLLLPAFSTAADQLIVHEGSFGFSFGGGYLRPRVNRRIETPAGDVTLTQHFSMAPGALARGLTTGYGPDEEGTVEIIDIDGYRGLLIDGQSDRPTIALQFSDDTVSLTGNVPIETLVNVMTSLEFGPSYKLPPDIELDFDTPVARWPNCPVTLD